MIHATETPDAGMEQDQARVTLGSTQSGDPCAVDRVFLTPLS